MYIASTKPLFAWDCLEDSPSLQGIKELLRTVPDAHLLEALRRHRGKGRNSYAVHTCWGVLLLTVFLRHLNIESCLRELRRNAGLRALIGIASERAVPRKWNMSRFMKVLGRRCHLELMREIFDTMIRRLGDVVPDLGQRLAGDSSSLSARGDGKEDPDGLPQPSGGRKEYTDEQGNVTRVLEWFGYKFHLLVDVKHEVALAYAISDATAADNKHIPQMLAQAQANLPKGRIETLAYDKAADDSDVHALLDEAGIKPLIENRTCWKEDLERMLPGHDGTSNIVYDESGTIYCYDKASTPPVRHKMAYIGCEPDRGTLKYRCPSMHEGWKCPSHQLCNKDKKYGKGVRVDRSIDLRRFPAIPRATKQFERLYKGRTAVERVNGRFKVYWGCDDGNITGPARFHAFMSVLLIVHAATATQLAMSPRREGTLGKMHLSPIAKALQAKISR